MLRYLDGRLSHPYEGNTLIGTDHDLANPAVTLDKVVLERYGHIGHLLQLAEQMLHAHDRLQVQHSWTERPDVSVVIAEVVVDEQVLLRVDHSVVGDNDQIEVLCVVEMASSDSGDDFAKVLIDLVQSDIELGTVDAMFVRDQVDLVLVQDGQLGLVMYDPLESEVDFLLKVGVVVQMDAAVFGRVDEDCTATWPRVDRCLDALPHSREPHRLGVIPPLHLARLVQTESLSIKRIVKAVAKDAMVLHIGPGHHGPQIGIRLGRQRLRIQEGSFDAITSELGQILQIIRLDVIVSDTA